MDDKTVVDFEKAKIEKRMKKTSGDQLAKIVEYEKSKISIEEYARNVKTLVDFVFRHPTTDSARVCASVLLSCYNGADFHVNLSSLSILDYDLYPAALAVIRGRVECCKEPHVMVDGGSDVFISLWKRYQHLTVTNRAKQQCDCCHGEGKFYETDEDFELGHGERCLKCEGRGWCWPEK